MIFIITQSNKCNFIIFIAKLHVKLRFNLYLCQNIGNKVIADFKVRLYKNTDNYVEGTHVSAQMIRINCDKKLLFKKLEQSLMQKFEQLHQPNTLVTIFWQEREENWIDISDQDALCNAMEKMSGPVYKLNVAFQTK